MKQAAIFIGIDKYRNPIQALKCARMDAQVLYQLFLKHYSPGLVDFICNEEAFSNNIIQKIRAMVAQLTPEDSFMLYFSGHGIQDRGEHYLLAADAENLGGIWNGTLAISQIAALTAVRGIRRLFILDSCRNTLIEGTKSATPESQTRDVKFANIVQASQAIGIVPPAILCSCSAGEQAYEISELGHGAFSQALIELVNQSNGNLELGEFAAQSVGQVAKILKEFNIAKVQTPELKCTPGVKMLLLGNGTAPRETAVNVLAELGKVDDDAQPRLEAQMLFGQISKAKACADRFLAEKRAMRLYQSARQAVHKGKELFHNRNYPKAAEQFCKAVLDYFAATKIAYRLQNEASPKLFDDDLAGRRQEILKVARSVIALVHASEAGQRLLAQNVTNAAQSAPEPESASDSSMLTVAPESAPDAAADGVSAELANGEANLHSQLEAQMLFWQVARAQACADKVAAEKLAIKLYKSARQAAQEGKAQYHAQNYPEAAKQFCKAVLDYLASCKIAFQLQRAANSNLLDNETAEFATQWRALQKSARNALAWVAACEAGQTLLADRQHNPLPRIRIAAVAEGRSVPAMITAQKGNLWVQNDIPEELVKGKRYAFHLRWHNSDAAEYIGEIPEFVCDWDGVKEFRVTLRKLPHAGVFQLADRVELELIQVAHGQFTMSRSDDENRSINYMDETAHPVTLTQDFYIGKYVVTQAQYQAVMGENPAANFQADDACPAVNISWYDAMQFCHKLNRLTADRRPAGYHFALPTEAQWEYAAIGGQHTQGHKYSGSDGLDAVGWYCDNSRNGIHPVGAKKANELGCYDMSGNVWEWCLDEWIPNSNAVLPEFSSEITHGGAGRAIRGGGWKNGATLCRVTNRGSEFPGMNRNDLGFRVALVSEKY